MISPREPIFAKSGWQRHARPQLLRLSWLLGFLMDHRSKWSQRRVADGIDPIGPPFPPLPHVHFWLRPSGRTRSLRELPWLNCRPAPRLTGGTVVEQCPRQKPTFSGLRAKTLFHRSEFFLRAPRASQEN